MTFARRRNRLTTHFSERIPVVKRRISVLVSYIIGGKLTEWVRGIDGMILRGETEVMREKPVEMSLCPPQIPLGHLGESGQRDFHSKCDSKWSICSTRTPSPSVPGIFIDYSQCSSFVWDSAWRNALHIPHEHLLTYLRNSEIIPTRCNNCVYSSQWLYSTCFGWQFHPSSGVQCCIWPFR